MNFKIIALRQDSANSGKRGSLVDIIKYDQFAGLEVEKLKGMFVTIGVTDCPMADFDAIKDWFDDKEMVEPQVGTVYFDALDSTGHVSVPWPVFVNFTRLKDA